MKFRIQQITTRIHDEKPISTFVIQKSFLWFWWKDIVEDKLISREAVEWPTYKGAENYMIKNYMGYGLYYKNGNIYDYHSYTQAI